jgi:Mitochondrial pyruvate carriers
MLKYNSLAAVNFCLFCVGTVQVSRIVSYNKELTGSTSAAFSKMYGDVVGTSKQVEQKVKDVAEEAKELA